MNSVFLQFPLKAEMLLPVRLFVGGMSSVAGLSMDDIEDLKVATQEACLILFSCGYQSVKMSFHIDNGVKLLLEASGENIVVSETVKGLEIIRALVDFLSYDNKDFSRIEMQKNFG